MLLKIPKAVDGIPGEVYPVFLTYPVGAVSVGIERWTHWFHDQRIPANRIFMAEFIDRVDRRDGGIDNAVGLANFTNGRRGDSEWGDDTPFALPLSTRLAPGETYLPGLWNYTDTDAYTYFAITAFICFPTQEQMTAYVQQVER